MTTPIRRASAGRLDELCATLAQAFVTEPMMTWPLGKVGDPEAAIEACFRIWDVGNIELGAMFEIDNGAGAAVWVAPENHARWIELERQARPAIHARSDDGGAKYELMWEWIEAHEPDQPMWYLDRVGVSPHHRGQGLGKALVQFGLELAAASAKPAFLETATARNVAFYASLGFRIVDEGTAPGGGPYIWFLRYDP
jgi:GNAT superfamily N-acetyltransferase